MIGTLSADDTPVRPQHRADPDSAVLERLHEEVAGLRRSVETRAPIEQAKGILMFLYQLDESAAFSVLQRWSMHANLKIRDLAIALIEVSVNQSPFGFAGEAARTAVRIQMGSAPVEAHRPTPPHLRAVGA